MSYTYVTPNGVKVLYMERDEVGYSSSIPRLGKIVPVADRDGVVHHHTVGGGANVHTIKSALSYARALQTIRPDLGKDVPYNFVSFVLGMSETHDLLIVEGRGFLRSGAHTVDTNRPGSENSDLIAIAWAGDFRFGDGIVEVGWPEHVIAAGHWLREHAPAGMFAGKSISVTGHKDHKATSCPGDFVYRNLDAFRAAYLDDPANWTEDIINTLPLLKKNDGFKSGRPEMKPYVKRLQAVLAIEGFVASSTFDANHSPDGLFGSGTESALKSYQKAHGLSADGLAGEQTWTSLLLP